MNAELFESEIESLAEDIRAKERALEPVIADTGGFVARLDGVSFRKYTSSLSKPFDIRFTEVMKTTARKLMHHFQSGLAYVQSDEITLFFSPRLQRQNATFSILHGGRVVKMASVLAGAASAFFVETAVAAGLPGRGFFDGRIVCYDPERLLLWRATDLRRNAINAIGQNMLGHQAIHQMKLSHLKAHLEDHFQARLEEKYGLESLYGTIFRRRCIQKEGYDPILQQPVMAKRTIIEPLIVDLLRGDTIPRLFSLDAVIGQTHSLFPLGGFEDDTIPLRSNGRQVDKEKTNEDQDHRSQLVELGPTSPLDTLHNDTNGAHEAQADGH
jgi:tRNA(His) 5'-end guanylyltransferase